MKLEVFSSWLVAGCAGLLGLGSGCSGQGRGAPAATSLAGAAAEDPSAPRPSSGCAVDSAPADGKQELAVGDLSRSYLLRQPAGYAAQAKKPWPLVLALHPNTVTSGWWDVTSGSRALRPLLSDRAVLVLPQARNDDWRGDLPLDLAYFEALLNDVEARLCIDTRRIFALGHSGGGSFAGVLGCYRRDIRAIAASSAVIYFTPADCIGAPAAWVTIGKLEAIPQRLEYRDFFRTFAGCDSTSHELQPAPCMAYDCPDPNRPVAFCSHVGGHDWPDFGSQAAVDFFAQF